MFRLDLVYEVIQSVPKEEMYIRNCCNAIYRWMVPRNRKEIRIDRDDYWIRTEDPITVDIL